MIFDFNWYRIFKSTYVRFVPYTIDFQTDDDRLDVLNLSQTRKSSEIGIIMHTYIT